MKLRTPEEILKQLIVDVANPDRANGPVAVRAAEEAQAYFDSKAKEKLKGDAAPQAPATLK